MADSRVPAVLSQLVTTATTAFASADCRVFRGPVLTGEPGDHPMLFIGYDGDPVGEFRTVNVTSSWAGLGARSRNEAFQVFCAFTLNSGVGDIAAATNTVYALYNILADAIRDNPSLNQAPRFTAAITAGELFTMPHPSGLQVRLTFTVEASARI